MKLLLQGLCFILCLLTVIPSVHALPFCSYFGKNTGDSSQNNLTISMTKQQGFGFGFLSALAIGFTAYKLFDFNNRAALAEQKARSKEIENRRLRIQNTAYKNKIMFLRCKRGLHQVLNRPYWV